MRILTTMFKAEYETGILVAVISLRGTGEHRCSQEKKQSRIRKSKKLSKNMLFISVTAHHIQFSPSLNNEKYFYNYNRYYTETCY